MSRVAGWLGREGTPALVGLGTSVPDFRGGRSRLAAVCCQAVVVCGSLTLSLSSQLLSEEERRSWRFRPEGIFHGSYAKRLGCIHVSPTRGNSRILEAGRSRSGPAGCGGLARTELVAGCVPDRKNEVVAPPLLAVREADAGVRGVASRMWSRPSSRPPRLRWRLHR